MVDIVPVDLEKLLSDNEILKAWEVEGKPKLIPQSLSKWPALEKWSGQEGKQRIRQLAGNATIEV